MSDALATPRQFTIVDPLQHDGFYTSRGYLAPGEGGYITTRDPELAAEIKEREPHALVTEHETPAGGLGRRGGGKMGGSMITVPSCGYLANKQYWFEKRDARRAQENGGTLEDSTGSSKL